MNKTNTMIVGQGIAGSLMAFMLHRKNIPFVVVDPSHENTASLVAAGMFTPISGKRKTIHPLVLQQIPFAIDIYQSVQSLLGVPLLHCSNIHQVFTSTTERTEFLKKTAQEDFAKLIILNDAPLHGIKEENGAVMIKQSGWVDCALFINSFRKWLQEQGLFLKKEFDPQLLIQGNGYMQYDEWQFENIIFCEGYKAVNNPFFPNEQLVPCKGDVLTVSCEKLETDKIVKRDKCYLIPAGKYLFKAGATYGWQDASEIPTEAGKKQIEDQLKELIENKYTIIDHKTAVRPTTANREVIVKQHHEYKNMFMLNGLGTKGVLQGPWWANYFVETYF
ncbi:MAG: FAD-binding oxidoreductase [Ferruginibacter sp.]